MKKSLITFTFLCLTSLCFSCGLNCDRDPTCYVYEEAGPRIYYKGEYQRNKTLIKLNNIKNILLEYKLHEYCNCHYLFKETDAFLIFNFSDAGTIYDLETKDLVGDNYSDFIKKEYNRAQIKLYKGYGPLSFSLVDLTKEKREIVLNKIKEQENRINAFFEDVDSIYTFSYQNISEIIKWTRDYKYDHLNFTYPSEHAISLIPFKNNKCVIEEYYSLLNDGLGEHNYKEIIQWFSEDFGTDFTEEEFLTKLGLN
ncbi:MAG: hypothetical protein IJ656_01530 [Bacilli bacterium]|nr:hypothetical protein [Bacilli bacterium]